MRFIRPWWLLCNRFYYVVWIHHESAVYTNKILNAKFTYIYISNIIWYIYTVSTSTLLKMECEVFLWGFFFVMRCYLPNQKRGCFWFGEYHLCMINEISINKNIFHFQTARGDYFSRASFNPKPKNMIG